MGSGRKRGRTDVTVVTGFSPDCTLFILPGEVRFVPKGGRHSMHQGLGKDFYSKGNSVKRSGPFSEPPDSEN